MPDRRTTARFRRRFKGITSATRPRTLAPHLRLVAAANVATLVVGLFAVSAPLRGAAAAGDCPAVGFSPGSGLASLSDADLARDLDEMLAVGAEWLRMDFSWASVEDTRGSYHWAAIDRVVNATTSRGIKVIGLLAYTPDWARAAGSDSIMYPPIDPSTFATFARAAVQRYSSRVKVWEVWNEPNITPFWRPRPDPVTYTNLLKPAYAAIKAADPEATVLAAGLSPAIDAADGAEVSPATFLRAIYDAGGGGSFDAVSMHPYSYPARPIDPSTAHWNTFHRLPLVYDVMVANGDGHKSIWLTEFGAPTGTNATAVSEAEQAAIITDAVNAFPQFPWAKNLLVYANRDAGTDAADREHNFGVVRRDFSPKAARDALRQAATTCGATQPTTVSIGDATVREGNSGFSTATFAISRSSSVEPE
ncbi:MAG TPA: cellulase family glycosylhydrolase, partial [Acidimicrobiia bacterium]|nr:cellulase family glycosylhydrolase [Acidimicrobiia bacterium]